MGPSLDQRRLREYIPVGAQSLDSSLSTTIDEFAMSIDSEEGAMAPFRPGGLLADSPTPLSSDRRNRLFAGMTTEHDLASASHA